MSRPWLLLLVFLVAHPAAAQDGPRPVEVDVELLLMVDVSRSMTIEEHRIQREGYAAALTSEQVLGSIGEGMIGRIALSYVEWAGAGGERVVVDWTEIASPGDATAFAEALLLSDPYAVSRTSISSALRFGADHFDNNGFQGLRRVIDISGDGPNNSGGPVLDARQATLNRGIIINGLPIMAFNDGYDRWSVDDLDAYYAACVTGGAGSFVIAVQDWPDFAEAIRRKLVLEIAGTLPAPQVIPAQAERYDCLIGEKIWERNRPAWGTLP
ncbi:DUF1194 domain-containing protein [Pelagovum pacificum]|uniref:DUF1194 domain-containing protein n=1 Tax=Pelagovum pacificum TaxID=2588711 RepID=A0A5C5GDK2_9RHOB|nr:DUF1194 domain-containing protein [Pelagovum pacificum]QQA44103.1 DUF1194 domain-containing protein [Pelagovum pacificum]TNY32768.1 DUF1194 domain-containing protein [Pelagovum pacificum]